MVNQAYRALPSLLFTKKILYEAIPWISSPGKSTPFPWFIDLCKGRRFTGAWNKKKGAKASFLAGFISRVCDLGETDYMWKRVGCWRSHIYIL